MSKRVFAAMSGGVDSSVAAALLKERGFDVVGIHMKMWRPDGGQNDENGKSARGERFQRFHRAERFTERGDSSISSVCKQQFQDRLDAMRTAAVLGIPFQTWDFSEKYRRAVVNHMIREYASGRTPNPDVMCNREIKFGLFLKKALEAGADYIATGHYVRLRQADQNGEIGKNDQIAQFHFHPAKRLTKRSDSPSLLLQAIDQNKDQSYFLWTLTQKQLRHCLFPIGECKKPEVRALARKFSLPTAEKPDSQGVCFIGELDMRDFLKHFIPERRGKVKTTTGKTVGEHTGAEFYTIGQREGLGIGGGIPYYVTAKDQKTNTLVVAEGPYDAGLFRNELAVSNVNWISGGAPSLPLRCRARIRYRQPVQKCIVTKFSKFNLKVVFDEPQRAVTPGQSVVFYKGETMLGGGVIEEY